MTERNRETSAHGRSRVRLVVFAGLVAGALVLGVLGVRYVSLRVEGAKEQDFSLSEAPWTIAEASLVYIKLTGKPPTSIWDCVIRDSQRIGAVRARGLRYTAILTPMGKCLHDECVLNSIRLRFPQDPNALTVRDGKLVCARTGQPTEMLSLEGDLLYQPDLSFVNAHLWEGWVKLARGELTGNAVVDAYDPNNPNWLRIRGAIGQCARATKDARQP